MGENWTFDAENLTVGYDGKTVIADVNFSVGAGERILLCGANGLGKEHIAAHSRPSAAARFREMCIFRQQ